MQLTQPRMSRSPIHGDVITFCGKGMENINSIDTGRLRLNLGSKAKPSISKPVWPVVEDQALHQSLSPQPPQTKDIVVEMQTITLRSAERQVENLEGLHGWAIAVGYMLFGMCMALANLLTLPCSHICVAASPIPMLCLLGQGLAVCGVDRQRHIGVLLCLCAWPVPLVCALWSLVSAAPLLCILAAGQCAASRHWGSVLCVFGLLSSLGLALYGPGQGLDAKWGVTLSIFFLVSLCVVSSLSGRAVFRIKYIL